VERPKNSMTCPYFNASWFQGVQFLMEITRSRIRWFLLDASKEECLMSKLVGAEDMSISSNPIKPFSYLDYLRLNSWLFQVLFIQFISSQVVYILKLLIFLKVLNLCH